MSRKSMIANSGYDSHATEDDAGMQSEEKELDRNFRVRDPIVRKEIAKGRAHLKIMSWNVSSLKSLMSANNKTRLRGLINDHNPDILLFQETKVQLDAADEYRHILDGYESFWNCSTLKKGYAGTAVFVKTSTISVPPGLVHVGGIKAGEPSSKKRKASAPEPEDTDEEREPSPPRSHHQAPVLQSPLATVQKVSYDFEDEKKCHDGEGRTITMEFDSFILVACYVPNAGQKLERLSYRVREWEPHMRSYLKTLSQRKPVVLAGDLNCAHLDLDVHNPHAKHLPKMHGTTPAERAAFTALLQETAFRDALRFFHPDARGQFTYWSQRIPANRPHNKGMRVDYFLCSPDMFPPLRTAAKTEKSGSSTAAERSAPEEGPQRPLVFDSYILPDAIAYSDHCPIVLVLQVEGN